MQEWAVHIPVAIYFIIGLGAFAAACLAIIKLWKTIAPGDRALIEKDIAIIKQDIHDIRTRVSHLEIDIAKIDQPAINKRFDGIEIKIDRLYEFLIERFAASTSGDRR